MGPYIKNRYVGLSVYLCVLALDIYALKASANVGKNMKGKVDNRLKTMGRFNYMFFTLWSFALQITFLVTAIFDEISKILNLSVAIQKRLSRFRAFIYNTLVFPCSILVSLVFWSIWHIDRDLIFSRVIDTFYPTWLNHTLHTVILVPLVVELLLPKKYNFVRFRDAAKILLGYIFIYQMLYLSVYFRHGVWLYPFYEVLSWTQRIIFGICQLLFVLLLLKIGIEVQNSKKPIDALKNK